MKTRLAVFAMLLSLAGLLLAPVPAAAADFLIQCWLYDYAVRGEGSTIGAPVTVTLSTAAGVVRGLARDIVGADGEWYAEFVNRAVMLQPGDRVRVSIGGTDYEHQLPDIQLKSIDPASNRIVGLIQPRRDQLLARVEQRRLRATGWVEQQFDTDPVTTAADGSFTIDTTAAGDLKRLGTVYVGYIEAPFAVARIEIAPGLMLIRNRGYGALAGIRGSEFEARLLGAGGVVRDSFVGTVLGTWGMSGVLEFTKVSGMPYRISTGNQVQVIGLGDFTVTVPRLAVSLDAASDVITVRTLPSRPVEVYVERYNPVTGGFLGSHTLIVVTGATGVATYDMTATADIQTGDVVEAMIQDGQGNYFETSAQALP